MLAQTLLDSLDSALRYAVELEDKTPLADLGEVCDNCGSA